jgi:mRNA turnover protein 4
MTRDPCSRKEEQSMAKSKRNQVVTEKSVLENAPNKLKAKKQKKADLMGDVQACLLNGTYSHVYVYRAHHLKAALLQRMRLDLTEHSRLFFSKNRLLAAAFRGRPNAEDVKRALTGPCLGLAFTSQPTALEQYVREGPVIGSPNFSKSGDLATQTISLEAGPLSRLDNGQALSATLEPYVRTECGLATSLRAGAVVLNNGPFEVCRQGQPLSPQAAKLLRVLGVPMAAFGIDLVAKYAL